MTPHLQHRIETERGFTSLLASLVAVIVLVIGLTILDVTLKQVRLAGVARQSERAFHAAQAGMECARFNDLQNQSFDIRASGSVVTCFGSDVVLGSAESGDEQTAEWTWGTNSNLCTDISVYKFHSDSGDADMDGVGITSHDCPEGFTCTVIKARGYNKSCSNLTAEQTVEREITAFY